MDFEKQYVGFIHSGRIRSKTSSININHIRAIDIRVYVTLEKKNSVQSLGCICSNSQKYIVWVKIINVSFVPKIIRILRSCILPIVNISKFVILIFD